NGARRASMFIAAGSGIGSSVAKIATAKTKIIQTIAAQNRMPSRLPFGTGADTASSARSSSSVAMTDPGVEHGIEQVDDEIHNDEARSHQQHPPLQDDEIAGEDRADQEPADTGKCEDRLDDQRAADQ